MSPLSSKSSAGGLALIEVLMVVTVLLLLAALVLPGIIQHRYLARRSQCARNLKQVGVAFRIWAYDHQDEYPMQVSTNAGGSREFVGSAPGTFRHFVVLSNELHTPKILFCPQEPNAFRARATVFRAFSFGPASRVFAANSNLSYFAGVDALHLFPKRFLTGDHNLTNGTPVTDGLLTLTTNRLTAWTAEMHVNAGNVGLADGSVQGFSTAALRMAVENTGLETHRLAMP